MVGRYENFAGSVRPTGEVDGGKIKGLARIRLPDGTIARAEVHWYEAHGIGRCELKIKRLLSEKS